MAVMVQHCYDKRISSASGKTISVVDGRSAFNHSSQMLGTQQLLAALEAGGVAQADMARVLRLPSSRISEMYAGKRQIKLDEAKRLVEAFGLEGASAAPPINEQTARLLVLHVANRLQVRLSPEDDLVQDLARDFQAFSKFARAHLPSPSPEATSGFLEGRSSEWPQQPPARPTQRRTR